jgi:hypothetical protein
MLKYCDEKYFRVEEFQFYCKLDSVDYLSLPSVNFHHNTVPLFLCQKYTRVYVNYYIVCCRLKCFASLLQYS